MRMLLVLLALTMIAFGQTFRYDWPDLAKVRNPILINLLIHVEEGRNVSPERYKEVAGGLRALGKTFQKYDARVNLDLEPGFLRMGVESKDRLMRELETDAKFSIGAFSHGAPARETLDLVRASGVTPVYLFGNWSRNNKDWVGDAVANSIDTMVGFFAIQSPDVTPGSKWDHEQLPWSRADRLNPWRVSSVDSFLKHDPLGKIIYIPGDSIDELEKLYERHLTGLPNRPLDRITPAPALNARDFEIASDYLRRQLVFASTDKINTWYIAVNSKKVRDFAAVAHLFDQWLADVQREFIKPGIARWANAREVRDAYLAWERKR